MLRLVDFICHYHSVLLQCVRFVVVSLNIVMVRVLGLWMLKLVTGDFVCLCVVWVMLNHYDFQFFSFFLNFLHFSIIIPYHFSNRGQKSITTTLQD